MTRFTAPQSARKRRSPEGQVCASAPRGDGAGTAAPPTPAVNTSLPRFGPDRPWFRSVSTAPPTRGLVWGCEAADPSPKSERHTPACPGFFSIVISDPATLIYMTVSSSRAVLRLVIDRGRLRSRGTDDDHPVCEQPEADCHGQYPQGRSARARFALAPHPRVSHALRQLSHAPTSTITGGRLSSG